MALKLEFATSRASGDAGSTVEKEEGKDEMLRFLTILGTDYAPHNYISSVCLLTDNS